MNDKPWMTVGPNPADPASDVVYVGWAESFYERKSGAVGSRIMLSSSADGAVTWRRPVPVARQPAFAGKRSAYLNGTSLVADPSTGRMYVAWEKFVDVPHGGGRFAVRTELASTSADGGLSFSRRVVIGHPRPVGIFQSACGNAMKFGPGRLIRITEFPSLAVGPGGQVLMAYGSADRRDRARVRLARSFNGGASWTNQTVAAPPDAFMPAIAADAGGVSLEYYRRVSSTLLKTELATSTDGATYEQQDLSSVSFPVPITFPNYDPLTAPCYMGDYVGVTRQAGTTFTALKLRESKASALHLWVAG